MLLTFLGRNDLVNATAFGAESGELNLHDHPFFYFEYGMWVHRVTMWGLTHNVKLSIVIP